MIAPRIFLLPPLAVIALAAATPTKADSTAAPLVAPSPDPIGDERCMTQAIYYEAGFEPRAGQQAVAQVVLNRLRRAGFPKTVCGVVYQRTGGTGPCQFSFVCDGALARRPAAVAWSRAGEVARAALGGALDGTVGDALNYHAWYVAPGWRRQLELVTRIGAHLFYRLPGKPGAVAVIAKASAPKPAADAPFMPWGLALTPTG